jgi:hypothetical protein
MANIRLESLKDPGSYVSQLALEGAGLTMDWRQKAMYEGRIFNCTVGTLSTGIQGGGAGTAFDLDQPEFLISIPSGTTVCPINFAVQITAGDALADHGTNMIAVTYSLLYNWDTTGACTSETPTCMKTVGGRSSNCVVRSAFTGDNLSTSGSDFVHDIDLARSAIKIDLPANGEVAVVQELNWKPNPSPYLVGPGTILGYWGGTVALYGFAQLYWAEYQTSELF